MHHKQAVINPTKVTEAATLSPWVTMGTGDDVMPKTAALFSVCAVCQDWEKNSKISVKSGIISSDSLDLDHS